MLELGPIEQNIAKQAMREGQPLPERIANAPQLKLGLNLFLDGFFELDSTRNHLNGLMPISWTCIKDYCEAYGYTDELQEDFAFLIRDMDKNHLNRLEKKMPKKGKK